MDSLQHKQCAIALFINHLNAWPDIHFEIHNVLTEFGKYSHTKWPLFQFMLINISSYQGITVFRTRGRDGWMEIYIQNSRVRRIEGLFGLYFKALWGDYSGIPECTATSSVGKKRLHSIWLTSQEKLNRNKHISFSTEKCGFKLFSVIGNRLFYPILLCIM